MAARAAHAPRIWLTPVLATCALLAVWLAWRIAGSIHQYRVVGPAVASTLEERGTVDVVVEIGFAPERFHASYFREVAPVGGRIQGRSFYLRDLDESKLAAVARPLWVQSVTLWQGDQVSMGQASAHFRIDRT